MNTFGLTCSGLCFEENTVLGMVYWALVVPVTLLIISIPVILLVIRKKEVRIKSLIFLVFNMAFIVVLFDKGAWWFAYLYFGLSLQTSYLARYLSNEYAKSRPRFSRLLSVLSVAAITAIFMVAASYVFSRWII
jgi:hypothetical protein